MMVSDTRFAVLLFTDIVGSTDLKIRYGVPAYSEALLVHNGHIERLARQCRDIRILQNTGDGYFAEAGGIADAVRFALLVQEAMREGPWSEICLTTRVGIHAGEISAIDSEGGSGIVAPAVDLSARLMGLAIGGQILLTRFPFDEARYFIREHPAIKGKTMPPLRWLAHGPYLMKGRDEPLDVFEVGADGLAPLTAPPDGEKAKRAIRPGEEETLGWRPAVGLEIPSRPGWHLIDRLGAGGFGEVWSGEHVKLRQRRAFKFCFDDERLRSLKREVTLVRLLRSALGDRDDIVRIHEIKLDEPPFYLESDLAPHGNLIQWAEKQGGLDQIPLTRRIALVAHTATALAAAHSLGVLHKDIKPTNILIFDGPDGEPRPRLVDFGIGALADPSLLGLHGVTSAGFTRATIQHSTGTPTYSPPEYLAGRPYTIQGDIYGLGVLLYQLITAKPLDPLAPGWERDITDPLLREDIAECVDGDPARRLPSAADLAERLLTLDQRRARIAEQEDLTRAQAARALAEAAAIAARLRATRFRRLSAAFAVLALLAIAGIFATTWQAGRAIHSEREAKRREGEAQAARRKADDLAENNRRYAYINAMRDASEAFRTNRIGLLRGILKQWIPRDGKPDLRGPEWSYFWNWLAESRSSIRISQQVDRMAVSGNGTVVVCARKDGQLKVLSVPSGEPLKEFMWGGAKIRFLALSIDGASGVFLTDGKRVVAFEGEGIREARALPDDAGDPIAVFCLSSPEEAVVVFGEGRILGLNAITGEQRWQYEIGSEVQLAALSTDGKMLAIGGKFLKPMIFDLKGRNMLPLFPASSGVSGGFAGENRIVNLAFSKDGERVACATRYGGLYVWQIEDGRNLLYRGSSGWGVAFLNDDPLVVTKASDDSSSFGIWNYKTGCLECHLCLAPTVAPIVSMKSCGEGDWLACLDKDGDLYLAPLQERVQRQLLRLGPEGYGNRGGCFSPDGSIYAVQAFPSHTDNDSGGPRAWNIQLWDPEAGRNLANPRQEPVCEAICYSRDGRYVFVAVSDVLNVYNARDWTFYASLRGHKSFVMSIASSVHFPNLVATGGADGTVRLWDLSTKTEISQLRNHTNRVLSLDWSAEGRLLASGGWDRVSNLWSMPEGRLFKTFRNGGKAVSFSPSGKEIGVGSFRASLQVINIERDEATQLIGVSEHPDPVFYTPDGSRFLAASDGYVYVFDAELHTLVASIRAMPGTREPGGAALNPQGSIMAASLGGVCHLLRFPPIPDVPEEKENLPFPY